jgi:Cu2+-containing amine oxidase
MSTEIGIPVMASQALQGLHNMHPLAALSREEIKIVSTLIKKLWPPPTEIHFKVLTLLEPPKDQVLSYLEIEHGSNNTNLRNPAPDRRAWVNYYIRNTVGLCSWARSCIRT